VSHRVSAITAAPKYSHYAAFIELQAAHFSGVYEMKYVLIAVLGLLISALLGDRGFLPFV
jgi:hypothetical protein